jgi:hypothetical protein
VEITERGVRSDASARRPRIQCADSVSRWDPDTDAALSVISAGGISDDATAALCQPEPSYAQSTGFVLDAEGRVIVRVYSSGAIGRLVAEGVVGMVRYLRDHAAV